MLLYECNNLLHKFLSRGRPWCALESVNKAVAKTWVVKPAERAGVRAQAKRI